MIIDSHVHFWQLARGDYDWMMGPGTEGLAPVKRNFGAEELRPLTRAAGVEKILLVQAAATVAESAFLLRQADSCPEVAGVVGWVAMDAPEGVDNMEKLAVHPALKGLRPMIHDIPDVDWMLGKGLNDAFDTLMRLDLTFDCLVRPVHLPNLLTLLKRHPALRAVICHGAKPEIAAGDFGKWAEDMSLIASETDAFCKLSGLITEAGPGWSVEALRPYVDHLLSVFGPRRLIWGSDWPVLTLTASYGAWWAAVTSLLADLAPAERALILGGNAKRAYRLG